MWFKRPRDKNLKLSDGSLCNKGDWVQHIEDAPNQSVKVLEVFETGYVLVKWPDGRRWIEKARFLEMSDRSKRLRKERK